MSADAGQPAAVTDQGLPRVTVVIPTHDRPQLLREAITSVLAQDYAGDIELIVVFDGAEPDLDLLTEFPERLQVIRNQHTRGLAGARNSGIEAGTGELVAFLDDDDHWLPQKLRRQVERYRQTGAPFLVTTAMTVDFDGVQSPRLAGTEEVTVGHLARSRMAMLHSSSFLFHRERLLASGKVPEEAPGSQNEDWDLLLRAAKLSPIAHVDEPLVVVRWGKSSFFARRWDGRNASLDWMMQRHPEICADTVGHSRVLGQLAFGEAAQGNRIAAWRLASRAIRRRPTQWRAWIAAPVALYPPSSEWVMNALHKRGRGV